MKKYLIPLMVGAFTLPVMASASSNNVLADFTADDLDIDGSGSIIAIENPNARRGAGRRAPPRTRFFSGFEYNYTTFDNAPRQATLLKIFADGSTKIHDNWRIRYVISERDMYTGKDLDKGAGRMNLVLAPRFEKWVNPNFSYFLEGMYKHHSESDGWEGKEYTFKPGASITYGRNFYNVVSEFQYKKVDNYRQERPTDNFTGLDVEQTFLRRVTPNFSAGFKLLYVKQNNEAGTWNKHIRPLVNYRFSNNIRTELNMAIGKNGDKASNSGHRYRDYNVNTNIPINNTFSAIVNLGYRGGDRYGDNCGWGDRSGLFTKVGLSTRF